MIIFRLLPFLFIMSAFAEGKIEKIFEKETSIKKPFELRDPFQAPRLKTRQGKRRIETRKGVLNNVPTLDDKVELDKLVLVGLLISKDRRAVVKMNEDAKETFTLKEGDKIGINGPELKAVLPGGIILVEEITNVYGEPEFIETVIPISK